MRIEQVIFYFMLQKQAAYLRFRKNHAYASTASKISFRNFFKSFTPYLSFVT